MPAYTSPDVRNLCVGAGNLYVMLEGDSWRHIGNVPNFEFKMATRTLDHHTPVDGIKVRDYSWTVELEAEVEIVMEEITAQNLALLMLGATSGSGGTGTTVNISARAAPQLALRYVANNDFGPRWQIDLFAVILNGDNAYDPITSRKSDFSKISVKGSALAVNGEFGVMTLI